MLVSDAVQDAVCVADLVGVLEGVTVLVNDDVSVPVLVKDGVPVGLKEVVGVPVGLEEVVGVQEGVEGALASACCAAATFPATVDKELIAPAA